MRTYKWIKLTLICINISCITLSWFKADSLYIFKDIGKLHPFIIHFSISMFLYQLIHSMIKNEPLDIVHDTKNRLVHQISSIFLELSLVTGHLLYFSLYRKTTFTNHFYYAIAFYILFNIYILLREKKQLMKLTFFSMLTLIILIVSSHFGGINHVGSSWWIW